jgi:hypothetical protein
VWRIGLFIIANNERAVYRVVLYLPFSIQSRVQRREIQLVHSFFLPMCDKGARSRGNDTTSRHIPTELGVCPAEDLAVRGVVRKQAPILPRLLVKIVDRTHVFLRQLDQLQERLVRRLGCSRRRRVLTEMLARMRSELSLLGTTTMRCSTAQESKICAGAAP